MQAGPAYEWIGHQAFESIFISRMGLYSIAET